MKRAKKLGPCLRVQPINLSETAWYYEEQQHLVVIVEARDSDGVYLKTTTTFIPWSKVRGSLRRYDNYRANLSIVRNKSKRRKQK